MRRPYEDTVDGGHVRQTLTSKGISFVTTGNLVPDTYFLEDAANLARGSILARLDPVLAYQPYFRLDLGGELLERLGFERVPLHQWLMRRELTPA